MQDLEDDGVPMTGFRVSIPISRTTEMYVPLSVRPCGRCSTTVSSPPTPSLSPVEDQRVIADTGKSPATYIIHVLGCLDESDY